MEGKVLVVDNDEEIRRLVVKALGNSGYDCSEADGFSSAKQLLCTNEFEVILTDKNMPMEDKSQEGGMELIRWASKSKLDVAIIMMTGHATIDSAIEALKLGAIDYLLKPFSMKSMLLKVARVCEYRKFINPKAVMSAYLELSKEITKLACAQSMDLSDCLAHVQERLMEIFQVFHSVERALLEHRQRLAEIAAYVEQIRDELPQDNPIDDLLQQIAEKASQRL